MVFHSSPVLMWFSLVPIKQGCWILLLPDIITLIPFLHLARLKASSFCNPILISLLLLASSMTSLAVLVFSDLPL